VRQKIWGEVAALTPVYSRRSFLNWMVKTYEDWSTFAEVIVMIKWVYFLKQWVCSIWIGFTNNCINNFAGSSSQKAVAGKNHEVDDGYDDEDDAEHDANDRENNWCFSVRLRGLRLTTSSAMRQYCTPSTTYTRRIRIDMHSQLAIVAWRWSLSPWARGATTWGPAGKPSLATQANSAWSSLRGQWVLSSTSE